MIIIISGTSSSGKSSVCEHLHEKLGAGWLFFSTDGYLSMLGHEFLGLHPENKDVCIPNKICYAKKHEDETFEIIPGEYCSKLFSTIPDVLNLIANQGLNIIVDSFISSAIDLEHYKNVLEPHHPKFVYLYADEAIIKAREAARGDRLIGSALHWMKSFNFQHLCDYTFDTGKMSGEQICKEILSKVTLA
jgi:chloramphenicol 3-O-phosphotransferase